MDTDERGAAWTQIAARLEELRAALPALKEQYPDAGDLLEAFAGEAEPIEGAAAQDEDLSHHTWIALNHMLVDAGILPEDHREL